MKVKDLIHDGYQFTNNNHDVEDINCLIGDYYSSFFFKRDFHGYLCNVYGIYTDYPAYEDTVFKCNKK